jgi:Na+/melibiose symporter-like transporter
VPTLIGNEKDVAATEDMRNAVFQIISLVPAVSCLISAIPFAFYSLEDKKQNGKKKTRNHIAKEPCF